MPDREKVIEGMEYCTKKVCIYKDTEKECPYLELCGEYEYAFEDCTSALAKDALALLKAQEPMVMTLEEVEKSYSKVPIWFEEQRLQTVYPAIYHKSKGPEGAKFADITDFYYQRQDWAYGTYGKTWRCWTSRPTDEQREAIPWN